MTPDTDAYSTGTPRELPLGSRRYFTTTEIITISMFGALGIVIGILGNVLHGVSGLMFIGPFILHTLLPGIVLFSCAATVKKAGAATIYSLIASLIAMPLMGVPLFIVMYVIHGLIVDGFTLLMGERMWTRWGILPATVVYGVSGVLILWYVVLSAQGLVVPDWVVLASIPANILVAIPAALLGLKVGKRAASILGG